MSRIKRCADPLSNYTENADGCWLWNGPFLQSGYGTTYRQGKRWTAHAYLYSKLVQKIPKGKVLMHLCSNKACVNPKHLRIGTYSENLNDAYARRERTTRLGTAYSPNTLKVLL